MLVQAKRFAQQSPRATPDHRAAHFSTDHHAEPGGIPFRQHAPVGDQTTAHRALAFLPRTREIASLLDARRTGKTQAFRRDGRHDHQTGVRRFRPTRRRLASVALPLLVELRFKKPCCRLRRIFDGWYWRFINYLAFHPDTASSLSSAPGENTPFVGARENISEAGRVKQGSGVQPGGELAKTCLDAKAKKVAVRRLTHPEPAVAFRRMDRQVQTLRRPRRCKETHLVHSVCPSPGSKLASEKTSQVKKGLIHVTH